MRDLLNILRCSICSVSLVMFQIGRLESESRCPSVIPVPGGHHQIHITHHLWLGRFCVLPFKCPSITQVAEEYGVLVLLTLWVTFRRASHSLETFTTEQTPAVLYSGFWHLYSAQKPNYSDWIWLPSHIRTDSPTVLYSARQPCAVRCLVMIGLKKCCLAVAIISCCLNVI